MGAHQPIVIHIWYTLKEMQPSFGIPLAMESNGRDFLPAYSALITVVFQQYSSDIQLHFHSTVTICTYALVQPLILYYSMSIAIATLATTNWDIAVL